METAAETAERALRRMQERDAERRRQQVKLDDVRWYVVQRFGRSDQAALRVFEEYKIEAYYPKILTLRKISRRQMSARQRASGVEVRKPVPTALFPGYIFMQVDARDPRIRPVFEIAHVGGLVCRSGAPVWMPDDVIAGIKSRENGDGLVPGKESLRAVFNIGDHVLVTDGPFASFPGIVERGLDVPIEQFDPETRIRVAVDIFGRATPVELEIYQVTLTGGQ